jgi:DNA primase
MPRIEDADIERVKKATDLVALVQSRGIALKKHGAKDWKGLCPFHGDKVTANFIVSPAKGLWHCMACGKAGNAIQFVQAHDGVSFRHAFELLDKGGAAAFAARPQMKNATIPVLPCPLEADAEDAALLGQVADYYHERLKHSPSALAYLASRGLDDPGLIERYRIGFADRSLGLRMPDSNRKEGETLRARLAALGVWRESGHEHFNGCIVVPLWQGQNIVSFYGRRIGKSQVSHLYPPGPHRGLLNPEAFASEEIILCEAVLDALTFCANGITNVSTLYGTEGFTEELAEALRGVRRVKLAYDADEAGERAAARDAERLRALGVEVWRIKFPWGMDANEYARKVTPAGKSLSLLVNAAAWCGKGTAPAVADSKTEPASIVAAHVDAPSSPMDRPSGCAVAQSVSARPAGLGSSLAASVSCLNEEAAKKEKPAEAHEPKGCGPSIPAAAALEQRGEAWFLEIDNREYRVTGLEKTLGADHLKIGLRVQMGDRFHLDQIDLMRDAERRRFVERAAEEIGLTPDLLKRDLGRVLLAVETEQARMMKPAEAVAAAVELSPEEREAALQWLRGPDLIARLRRAFHLAGIIGEDNNTLVAYLAGVSRKLERPLAIIIQSASAAGKTTLMDAVLSFFPEEDRVKYSAMTGQSLYYLGETNLKHKILAVVEEAGAEKASYALKLLQSEGELTIASTGKDPQSGRMVTQEYHVEGPVMIFLTTTDIDLDEELQNRCLTLAVDESNEQTARIHAVQRERRTLAGLIAREERKDVLALLKNAQRLLVPVEVLNPFAPALTFPSRRTRNRRDHEKYLTLIDSIALLHQHQRARGQHVVGGRMVEYIEVTLEDIALANEIAPEVLGRSLDELPPQTRRLLEHIRALVKTRRGEQSAKVASTFSRREIKEVSGWSLTQVRVHLARLIELEFIAARCGRFGSAFHYELLIDADGPEIAARIGLIEVEKLRKTHAYGSNLTGQNGHLAGGGETPPATVNGSNGNALAPTWRPDANAYQEATDCAAVS